MTNPNLAITSYFMCAETDEEARRRAAVAAGASANAVPAQKIAGGMGETPGFNYCAHLESVISHGQPPIKWLKRALLGAD